MTVAAPPLPPDVEHPVVLDGVSWETYQSLLNDFQGRPAVRLTYDSGWLEIMTVSQLHESVKKLVARLIEAYADAADVTVEGFGSSTYARKDLQKGLEPDECYYIQHAAEVMGKTKFDFAVDPPPDLAIEIEVTRRVVPRQPIYAALGVPELWRWDGRQVIPMHLTRAGKYVPAQSSLAFPDLPMEQLNRFLAVGVTSGQSAAVRALREWLKTAKRPSRKKK
jgi:Uma2 family endonuclease